MKAMNFRVCVLICGFALCAAAFAEEDPDKLLSDGKAELWASQDDPKAIVNAARLFSKASTLFEKAGRQDEAVEVNSYLYWCKKKMNRDDMDAFLKTKDDSAKALEKVGSETVAAAEAQRWYDRVDKFATSRPDDHLLIAIRFFEVADRFKGSDISLKAQDRSLTAMQQALKSARDKDKAQAAAAAAEKPEAPKPAERPPVAANAVIIMDLANGRSTARLPEPPADAQKTAETMVREIFKVEYAKAKGDDRQSLANLMGAKARDNMADHTLYFVLQKLRIILNAEAGELWFAHSNLRDLEKVYAIDSAAYRRNIFKIVAANTRDAEVQKRCTALTLLLDKPDDPAANTVATRQIAGTERDIQAALPYAEKCNDEAWKAAVIKYVEARKTKQGLEEAGDALFDLAQKEPDRRTKVGLMESMRTCYILLNPKPTGLSKMKIDKRDSDAQDIINGLDQPAPGSQSSASREPKTATPGKPPKLSATSPGLVKAEELADHVTFPRAGIPYKLGGALTCSKDVNGGVNISAEPGVEIIGGSITLNNGGKMLLEGTADKPIVLRNIVISQDLGGYFSAKFVVFDKCEFRKAFGSFGYFSSKWELTSCILFKTNFMKLSGVDYGFRISDCALVDCILPEIEHRRSERFDHSTWFRKDWNKLEKSLLLECQVSGTVFWCTENCNLMACKFIPGDAYESDTELTVDAYLFNCLGTVPKTAKRRAVTVTPAAKPWPAPVLPEKAPVAELGPRMRLLYPPKR